MKVENNSKTTLRASKDISSLVLALLILGCSQGGFSSGTNPSTSDGGESIKNNVDTISFDEVASIPLLKNANSGSYLVKISNTFDQKYFLKKIRVINPLTEKEDSSLATINAKLCSSIAANSSCSLNVTSLLNKSGSFIIEASISGEDKQLKTIRQIIRVSDKIVPNNGIAFKNDITKIVTANGQYSLSIPVRLTENFDDIKATNGSLVCNGGFTKNSSCSYLLSGDTLGDNTLVETKLTGYRKGKVVSSTTYTTRVATAVSANLLLSQPADIVISRNKAGEGEEAPETNNRSILTVYNSGNYNATNIASKIINGTLQIVTGGNTTCKTLLAPHSNCNIEIEAFGQSNGNGSIQIDYRPHDGKDVTALTNISANILYMISGEAVPGILFEHIGGGLQNTARGTTSTRDIRVSNNGWYNLTNLKFNLNPDNNANGSFVIAPTGSKHSCSIDGTQGLVTQNPLEAATRTDRTDEVATPTSFCEVRISYTAPATDVDGNVALTVAGNYQESQGTSHSYSNTASYEYSAINSFNVLTISPIHAVNLSAPPNEPDNIDVEEFLLTNTSSQGLVFGTLDFASPLLGVTRPTDAIPDTVVCDSGNTLAGFASCTVRIEYRPTAATPGAGTKFNIPVAKIGDVDTSDTVVHTIPIWVVSADGAGGISNINTTVTARDSAGVVVANTDPINNPYAFVLSNGNLIDFTYTFTNTGSPAMHFNVATSSLPVQAEIVADRTTCAVGSNIENLGNVAPDNSCNVVVRVPRASAVAAGLITDANTTEISLPYSWTDSAGVNRENNKGNNRQVTITTGWASRLTATATGSFIADNGERLPVYRVTVNTTITGLATGSGIANDAVITVTPVFTGASNVQTCTLSNSTTATVLTCPSTFDLPASMPQGEYSVVVRLTAGTGATASTQQTTATLDVIRGIMFLSAPLTALDFGSYAAADAICNANRPVGYGGLSYKAMLPARTDPIFVEGRDYYSNNNLNGTTPRKVATANNTQYLSTANLDNPISLAENTFIAIGHYTGNATTARGQNCNGWASNLSTENFVQGNVSQKTSIWRGDAADNISACNSVTHRLLCVAQ